MTTALRLALLGAPGSGKSRLARELRAAAPQLHVDEAPPLAPDGHRYDHILLLGLDLPGAARQAPADRLLRGGLDRAGLGYRVVYGRDEERLANALVAIGLAGDTPAPAASGAAKWVWACDKCSDPQCEHKLFSDLKARRGAA